MRDSMATGELTGFTAREFEWVIEAFPIARNFLVADLDGAPVGLILSDQRLLLVDPPARRQGQAWARQAWVAPRPRPQAQRRPRVPRQAPKQPARPGARAYIRTMQRNPR